MTQGVYVARDYVMDPAHDDLLFDGTEMRVGMIVLLADDLLREGPPGVDSDRWKMVRARETARWCEVQRVEQRGDLISFLAAYPDGTKAKRTYNVSFAWYVKKASIPQDPS